VTDVLDVAGGLEPDDDTMHRFLTWWFEKCNRGYVELGWTSPSTGAITLFRRFDLNELAEGARFAAMTNAREGVNMYYRPATIDATVKYTQDSNVVQLPGCWADADEADTVERVLHANSPAPSAQVVTGHVPALRSQFLWRLSEPLLAGDWVRHLNRQAATLAASDTAVVNPSTLMRLPGSIAWPKKPGRVPELTEWVRPDRHQDSHTHTALRMGFPSVPDEEAPSSASSASTTAELLNPMRALIDQVRGGPHWHEPALRLVALLVSRGRQDAEILAMAEHLTWPNYTAQQTRDDLAKMIEGARRKGYAPDEEPAGDGAADIVDDVMNVTPPPATFPLLSNADLAALPDPEWLIEDWIVANTLCVVYGAWGSYKSFLVLHAALCLATGTPYFNLTVAKCDVLYIAGEGAGGLKQRVAAWEQHHNIMGLIPGFRVIPLAVNLMNQAEAERVVVTAVEAQKATGFFPRVVIVDTLHRSMPGGDENSAKDIGIVITNSNLIQRRLNGATLIPVHHSGKDAERGMRGSTGLPGAADTAIRATRNEGAVAILLEKQKDAPDGIQMHLQASLVTLPPPPGVTFPKPRTSLVLVPAQEQPQAHSPRPPGEAGIGYDVLLNLTVTEGVTLPVTDGFPSSPTRGVTIMAWRREFYRRLGDKTPEAKRQAYGRMLKSLRAMNKVALLDNWVWLVHPNPEA
jgi:hypothetical protein